MEGIGPNLATSHFIEDKSWSLIFVTSPLDFIPAHSGDGYRESIRYIELELEYQTKGVGRQT